uniref:Uncharacterized protein n=1 Tax=Triticum urartu TaxID=4572 RepID=A0A8R7UHF6_TRIUA
MERGRACTRTSVVDTWVPAPLVFVHRRSHVTSSSGGERRPTMTRPNTKRSRGGKWSGGPEDDPDSLKWLGEAREGTTASTLCGEAATGVGGDGADSVNPRLPSKPGSMMEYL